MVFQIRIHVSAMEQGLRDFAMMSISFTGTLAETKVKMIKVINFLHVIFQSLLHQHFLFNVLNFNVYHIYSCILLEFMKFADSELPHLL